MSEELHKLLEKSLRTTYQDQQQKTMEGTFAPYQAEQLHSQLQVQSAVQQKQLTNLPRYQGILAKDVQAPKAQQMAQGQRVVTDEYANISWVQKQKLKSRHSTDLKQAKQYHIAHATGLSLALNTALSKARTDARINLNGVMDNVEDTLQTPPPLNLFDKAYHGDSDVPYDIQAMELRRAQLERLEEHHRLYRWAVASGDRQPDAQYEAYQVVQRKVHTALNEAMEAIFFANGVTANKVRLHCPADVDRQALLEEKIQAYQTLANQFQAQVEYETDRSFQSIVTTQVERLGKGKEASPEQQADLESLGFAFHYRPTELDQMRAMLDNPAHKELVEANATLLRSVWADYIRTLRTADHCTLTMETALGQMADFTKQAQRASSSRAVCLQQQATLERILGHLIQGTPLETADDDYLTRRYTYSTQASRQRAEEKAGAPLSPVALTFQTKMEQAKVKRLAVTQQFNAMDKAAVNSKMDRRVVSALFSGWKTDLQGQPLTEADQKEAERQTRAMSIVMGNHCQERSDFLMEQVNSYIHQVYPQEMFSEDYYLQHFEEVEAIIGKCTILQNLLDGAPEFVQTLTPVQKAQIKAAQARSALLTQYYSDVIGALGLRNNGQLLDHSQKDSFVTWQEDHLEQLTALNQRHSQKMEEARLDATYPYISQEEVTDLKGALALIQTPRFQEKLALRQKEQLTCDSLEQIFRCLAGSSMEALLQEPEQMVIDAALREEMRLQCFGGKSFTMNELDFGGDDMDVMTAGIRTQLRESPVREEAVIAPLDKRLKAMEQASVEDAVLKWKAVSYGQLEIGLLDASLAVKAIPGMEDSPLYHQLRSLWKQAEANYNDISNRIVEKDMEIYNQHFYPLTLEMALANLSFLPWHQQAYQVYMTEQGQALPEGSRELVLEEEKLPLYGKELSALVTAEAVTKKYQALGTEGAAWLKQLTDLVAQYNHSIRTKQLVEEAYVAYTRKTSTQIEAEEASRHAREALKKVDASHPQYDQLVATHQACVQAEAVAQNTQEGVPLFANIEGKLGIMHLELMLKRDCLEQHGSKLLNDIKKQLRVA